MGWWLAVRRSLSRVAPPWLLTLRWIDVHRRVGSFLEQRRSCRQAQELLQHSAGERGAGPGPALAAAAVQAGREPGFCCGPPAATATARILGTDCRSGGLQPLSSGSRAGQPQQGQPQQPCSRGL